MVIGITGRKRSGKDTLAEHLVSKGFIKLELARPLKEWLEKVNPILNPPKKFSTLLKYIYVAAVKKRVPRYLDVVKYLDQDLVKDEFPEIRRLLQITGTDLVRNYDKDFWVNIVANLIASGPVESNYVISDVRFDNEIARLSDISNNSQVMFLVIKVVRDSINLPDFTSTHSSENGVSDCLVDFTLYNNGTIDDMTQVLDKYLNSYNSSFPEMEAL